MLEIKGLRVRYENRSKPAVDGMDLRVDAGEFVLLTGDSASGKSTAMQAVCGFIPEIIPAERKGEVVIDGKLCEDAVSTARYACMVQQDPETQFCTETVEEEVAFGPENFQLPRDKVREVVDEALRSVGASSLLERKLSTLSGGEKQKVAIASALAVDPKVLVLDEPTSSLDPGSVREIVGAFETLRNRRKGTVVVVEHRPEGFVHLATRLVEMAGGRITGDLRRGDPGFADAADKMLAPKNLQTPTRTQSEARAIESRSLSYEIDGKKILDDVTFDVHDGAAVALMGANGSGKTTLIRHLMGLVDPQKGSVRILNHVLRPNAPVRPWLIGRDVGLVFQNPNHQLFERTVEKELRFASVNFGVPTDRANAAAKEFEESEGVSRYVHPQCLSFGQKRRMNIVSASAHGPRILMLDEPFAGQDPRNASAIARMLADLQRSGKTLVVVTHDPAFARAACTDLLLLKDGRVATSGRIGDWTDETWNALFKGVW